MEDKIFIYGSDYNPEQWRDNPKILEQDIELMKKGGFNAVSIGIFSWGVLEPVEGEYDFEFFDNLIQRLYNEGIKILLATPSASLPMWMSKRYPEMRRMNENRVRVLPGRRAEHCLSSPILREKVYNISKKLSERYADKVYMWHISNEYYGACHCPLCQMEFREYLRKKYNNDINLLNSLWCNDFWSGRYSDWDEIESPAPHGRFSSGALQLEWNRFTTLQTIDFMKNEINAVEKNIPVTTNFHGGLRDLNYWEISKHIDMASWDMYPHWHLQDDFITSCETAFVYDLCRTFKQKPFLLMESAPSAPNHTEIPNKMKRNGFNILSSLHAVAHGADSVQYFQWRKSRGGYEKHHGAVVDHYGGADTRVFSECAELGNILKQIKEVANTPTKSDVAIIYDFENSWILDYIAGYSREHLKYKQTCIKHYEYFYRNGINVDIISQDNDLSKYKIVIAPMLYMLKEANVERIKEYVSAGGNMVMTYISAVADEYERCYLNGIPAEGLKEVFGIRVEETDCILPEENISFVYRGENFDVKDFGEMIHAQGSTILASYKNGMYSDMPAVTKNSYEKGSAYYIGVRDKGDFLDKFYKDICEKTGIEVEINLPDGVTAATRGKYIFLQNFTSEVKAIKLNNKYTDLSGCEISKKIELKRYDTKILVGMKEAKI